MIYGSYSQTNTEEGFLEVVRKVAEKEGKAYSPIIILFFFGLFNSEKSAKTNRETLSINFLIDNELNLWMNRFDPR